MTEQKVPLLNIANALTVLRLVLVPFFVVALWQDTTERRWIAFAIFAVAAITDKLDGKLARKHNLVTDFGKMADAIADKALIISALLLASWHGWLWWWVTIVFIVRELGITIMRAMMAHVKVMAAGMGGKIKMMAQSFGLAGLILPWYSFLPEVVGSVLVYLSWALLGIALIFALTSAYEYIREALRLSRAAKSAES
ncbi:MAG: CDP-diacylglycerol--glycerol-3-phosphate 3-phosphatidyltransferase [Trueperella sp.]|nr:CDP-diacylglycerol--glycerol-3-phosphate 3-phosphatidyltransferase [Trueperella sp.]